MSRIGLLTVLLANLAAPACDPAPDPGSEPNPDTAGATASGQAAGASTSSPLAGTAWRLVAIADSTAHPAQDAPILEVLNDGRVTGNTGCNVAGGPWSVDGEELSIGPLVTTRMACLDDRAMWMEAAYIRTMDATRSFRIANTELELLDQAGVTLARFRR